jgi:YesN/AraC family two-component response regulator
LQSDPGKLLSKAKSMLHEAQRTELYPIHLEKELQQALVRRDEATSKQLLNELLGYIFLQSEADVSILRLRIMELLVLLSRAAIEGGADQSRIFLLNENCLNELEQLSATEQLRERVENWLVLVLHRFMGYLFEFQEAAHRDALFKAISYIRENCEKKLTLDEVAAHVYISASYLSRIMREETGRSFPDHLNQIRIERACEYLAQPQYTIVQVSELVGYSDQSYFTKVFKAVKGISPRAYRMNHTDS